MTQDGSRGRCRVCDFCRQVGEALHCVRRAPTPDPITGHARWPLVRPTDYCGDFCAKGQEREACPVKRETQIPNDASSIADAGSASANHPSSIIHHQSPALPVLNDEFGPYCKIPLTQNRFAKVDPEDYVWLAQFRWCCKAGRDCCYAVRHIQEHGRTKRIHMHRQIMNTPDDMICDHKNHDGLDNRKHNCRNCTIEQNNANRRKRATGHGSRAPTSQYLGVSWCPRRKKWVSYVKHKGKARNLGLFEVEEDAARAHDAAAWAIWGEYANLNFPHEYPAHPANAAGQGAHSSLVPRRSGEEQPGGGGRPAGSAP
jgi:hypothetical protein